MALFTIKGASIYWFGSKAFPLIFGGITGLAVPGFFGAISENPKKIDLLIAGLLAGTAGVAAGYVGFQFWWAAAHAPAPICWAVNPFSFLMFVTKGTPFDIGHFITYVPMPVI